MKRKRGRPSASNASKPAQAAAAPTTTTMDAGAAEETRPRKRGRPRQSLESNPDATPAQSPNVAAQKKKAGRPRGDAPKEGEAEEAEEEAAAVKKRHGKQQEGSEDDAGRKKKKRGPKKGLKATGADVEEDQQPGQRSKTTKARRQTLQDITPSDAQNKNSKSQKGGKRQEPRSSDVAAEEPAATSPPQKRKRGRPSNSHEKQVEQDQESDNDEEESGHRRRKHRSERQTDGEALLPPKRYLHVAPLVRGVKQSTIDAKWTPLGPPSVAIASEVLELAHRPILQRMTGTARRRQHTSAALSIAYRRITRKLQRGLPFPPAGMPSNTRGGGRGDGGRETELDFESVLDGRQGLERQLDPALHAVELLQKERDRMVQELERDYMTLRNLEAGARTQAREQREQLKRAHVLAPEASRASHPEDVEMIFDEEKLPSGNTFKVRLPFIMSEGICFNIGPC